MAQRTKSKEEPEILRSVNPTVGIQLLQKQISKAKDMLANRPIVTADHTAWNNTTRDYLIKAFGSKSPNVNAVVIHASSSEGLYMGMGDAAFEEYMASLVENQIRMLNSCIEQLETEIELSKGSEKIDEPYISKKAPSNKIFIVHGHNQGVKETVARFIEKLDLEAVILHEKPNKGRTIIEKFSDYSDVHFAIVLLTADDLGKEKNSTEELEPRARQNVIFELGYFIGKLSRSRVCALYEEGVDIPSDYQGVIFIPVDKQERWKSDIVRELLAAGFNVDANKIFSADSV